ncbi:MAG: hypothetical protein E7398_02710 [Ruminococcaceae bacterium]|nr:hypothetical protein [Oscillospiraceae bacterium]
MLDNKIKKKLEKMLDGIDADKLREMTEMLKSGDNVEKNFDFNKASAILKSLNLENEITPEMIIQGMNTLKNNPDILSELKKK